MLRTFRFIRFNYLDGSCHSIRLHMKLLTLTRMGTGGTAGTLQGAPWELQPPYPFVVRPKLFQEKGET